MLQALNILEDVDLKGMGYNSARYIHTVYQAMNLAFADRDFYYGDPYFPPEEPIEGPALEGLRARSGRRTIDWAKNDPNVKPGDPYPFQGETNPYSDLLGKVDERRAEAARPQLTNQDAPSRALAVSRARIRFEESPFSESSSPARPPSRRRTRKAGSSPSRRAGGWLPAVIAGKTGIGMSQRMQSFVLDRAENPFNVVEPGKRPRVTLTPTLALKDGKPYLAFAVQGGDSQDQNLLQFFLNVVEFGMTVQEATEAANINSYQMRSSFGAHESRPGAMMIARLASRLGARRAHEHGLQARARTRRPRAPSTRSISTASTARCGAGRATTARTTGSGGEATISPASGKPRGR